MSVCHAESLQNKVSVMFKTKFDLLFLRDQDQDQDPESGETGTCGQEIKAALDFRLCQPVRFTVFSSCNWSVQKGRSPGRPIRACI